MKELVELVKALALSSAYQVSEGPCRACGLPGSRWCTVGYIMPMALCDTCEPPAEYLQSASGDPRHVEYRDSAACHAVRRLMKIVRSE